MTASRSNASCPRLPQTIHIFHSEVFIPFTSVLSYGPYSKPVKGVAKVKFIQVLPFQNGRLYGLSKTWPTFNLWNEFIV